MSRKVSLPCRVPAEVKKSRFDEETIQKLLSKEWWNGKAEAIEKVEEMEFRVGEYINPSVSVSNASISA